MQDSSCPKEKASRPTLVVSIVLALLVSWSCKTASLQKSQVGSRISPTAGTDSRQEAKDVADKPQLTKGQEHFILKELWAGTILQQRGDQEAARSHYRHILDILPNSPHVLTQLAKSYLETNEIDRALEAAEKAVKADPPKVSAYEVLGQAYARKRDWAKAAEQYQRLLEQIPYSHSALQQLADMQARAGKIEKAVETYRRLARIDPGRSGFYYYYIASLLANTQRLPEAIDAYLQLLEEYPDHFEIYRQVALLYQRLNQFDEAVATYLHALDRGPSPDMEIPIRRDLAQLYLRRGSRSEAYAQYARIHELSPKSGDTLYAMSLLLLQDKEYERALLTVDELLAVRPNEPKDILLKCEILSKKRDWQEGTNCFLKAFLGVIRGTQPGPSQRLRTDQFAEAILRPGIRDLFVRGGRVNELVAALRQCLDKFPDNRYVPLALLIVQVQADKDHADLSEDIELVIERWDAALAQDDRQVYNLYLDSLYNSPTLGYLTESSVSPIVADILWRASEKFDDDAATPLILSILQFNDGEWANAEKVLRLVTQRTKPTDPNHHTALERLGLAYEKMKRIDDAVEVIKKLIEIAPDSAEGYNMLGYLYADHNRNLSEAETLIKKALELAPGNGNFIDSLGWVYYRQGRYRQALETLIEAKEKSEDEHPVIYDHLGDAYQAMGYVQQAVGMWRKALEVGPRFPFDFTAEMNQTIEDKIRSVEQHLTP